MRGIPHWQYPGYWKVFRSRTGTGRVPGSFPHGGHLYLWLERMSCVLSGRKCDALKIRHVASNGLRGVFVWARETAPKTAPFPRDKILNAPHSVMLFPENPNPRLRHGNRLPAIFEVSCRLGVCQPTPTKPLSCPRPNRHAT